MLSGASLSLMATARRPYASAEAMSSRYIATMAMLLSVAASVRLSGASFSLMANARRR